MSLVLGLDSSTQSLSAVILDPSRGVIVSESSVNFGKDLPQYRQPNGYLPSEVSGVVHADPRMWLEALDLLFTRMVAEGIDFSQIEAVSGSGQQHGSVYLKRCFPEKVASLSAKQDLKSQLAACLTRKTSPIWMDSSTGAECAEIAEALGGNQEVCARSGSIAVERFTGPQIRKFFKEEPECYRGTGVIHLVSSFLASVLAGKSVALDFGDGAGMNLMNLANQDWDADLLAATADDLAEKLPPLVPATTKSGPISSYFVEKYGFSPACETVVWSGDNPCSLIGMGAASPGKLVISLGTSDTLFAAMPEARTDPQGFGHVFGNPAGGYMSLICFKNGSLAREAVKDHYQLDWSAFETEAISTTPIGNDGLLMLPFFEPEITPLINTGGPVFSQEGEPSASQAVRAVLEGQFLNMRLHSGWLGVDPAEILLTGGASENDGIAQVVANVFGVPVKRLDVPGSATIGAAMRAAHAIGHELSELESHFSRPKAGRTITPENQAKRQYDLLLNSFDHLLRTKISN